MKKQDIINNYNISEATLRNWKKLGYLDDINKISEAKIKKIITSKTGGRRNKKNSTDYIIPASYVQDKKILNIINKILDLKTTYNLSSKEVLYETILRLLHTKINESILTEMDSILGKRTCNLEAIDQFNLIKIKYDDDNDFLGCLYMSLLSVGKKDKNGIFYTPFNIVKKIIDSTEINETTQILDPGCGSGNFLIQAYKKLKKNGMEASHIIHLINGYDIDKIAVLLAKVNLYLLDENIDYNEINIVCNDFLNTDINKNFDVIIGNPPWGKKYTKQEKAALQNKYGSYFIKQDSFSQFIFKSFSILNQNGELSFVLPSSILNIALHKDVREFILGYDIKYIKQIGRTFEEIVTDVIIMSVKNSNSKNNKCLYDGTKVLQTTFLNNSNYNFLVSSNTATSIIKKIKKQKSFYLTNEIATFALGVVTGDNKKYILNKKVKRAEPIISGKDISKYNMNYDNIQSYIVFNKDKFQQVAQENLYRYPNKIIYKFIGKKLVFAVERNGLLTLNSANVININEDYNVYYISAILNSRVTQLYFDETYATYKLLKNHIESFPIFDFDSSIKEQIIDLAINTKVDKDYNEEIENIIYTNLDLTEKEIQFLKENT